MSTAAKGKRKRAAGTGKDADGAGDDGAHEAPLAPPLSTLPDNAAPSTIKALLMPLSTGGRGLLMGARIPKDFFVVSGFGETDAGGGADPYETGSYDLALEEAGIENFNIVPYTSVMPAEATEISVTEARRMFHHGSVLEVIMAKMNGTLGDRISAGVARMQVRRKKDGMRIGGFAAEYEGHASGEVMRDILQADLQNIFERRYNTDEYEVYDTQFTTKTAEVTKGFGTVLASICFITYLQPVYEHGSGGEADGEPAQPHRM